MVDLGDRTKYIGASDTGSIFNVSPYGCAKRLWYEKKGVLPDYAITRNPFFERGNDMEDLVAQKFQKKTGIKAQRTNEVFSWDAYWFFKGHVDRLLPSANKVVALDRNSEAALSLLSGRGVLEIKTANKHVCRQIEKDGVSAGYILQLQSYLFLTRLKWGCFAIFNMEEWQLMPLIYQEENIALQREIKEQVQNFWVRHMQGNSEPLPLEDGSKQCADCNWRIKCKGQLNHAPTGAMERDDDLFIEAINYKEANETYKDAKKHKEECKGVLADKLGGRDGILTQDLVVKNPSHEVKKVDTKGLRAKCPRLVKKFTVTTTQSRLSVTEA